MSPSQVGIFPKPLLHFCSRIDTGNTINKFILYSLTNKLSWNLVGSLFKSLFHTCHISGPWSFCHPAWILTLDSVVLAKMDPWMSLNHWGGLLEEKKTVILLVNTSSNLWARGLCVPAFLVILFTRHRYVLSTWKVSMMSHWSFCQHYSTFSPLSSAVVFFLLVLCFLKILF